MERETKLNSIKFLHTLIWIFFNFVIFYMLFAAITNRLDQWLWIGFGLVFLEAAVLLAFRIRCPLTLIARRYSSSTKDNFDIFLPRWVARNTKLIYTAIMILIAIITIFQITKGVYK